MLEKREFDKSDFFWRLSTTVVIVSGLFSILIFVLLIVNYWLITRADPVNHELLTQMRQTYASLPEKDEALAQRIRDLDLLTRKAYFTTQTHLRVGAWMILISVSIFLIAFKNMIRWRPQVPELADVPTADKEFLAYAQSRQLITWAGIGLLAGGMMTSYFTESALTAELLEPAAATAEGGGETVADGAASPEGTTVAAVAPTAPPPDWAAIDANWPSFRGPGAAGVAKFTTAPTSWDVDAGTNIKWKVDLTLPGNNSPVVWGNRVYLTVADEQTREVHCYDTETGQLLWNKAVTGIPGSPAEPPADVMEDTGFAASTMVVHGDLAFALFANGDLVALNTEGTQVWARNLGVTENHYGHSSSLLAYDKFLYVQYDDTKAPRLLTFDTATGNEAWTVTREKISWASPMLARTTSVGEHLILVSEKDVDAYNPLTGAPTWKVTCLGGEVSPSAAYANGMVFVANEYAVATGITLGGTPEAVEATAAWEFDEYLPEVASPVGDGERFYYGTAIGDIVCLDAKTGENLWTAEAEDGFYSSPILVGDKVYIADMGGTMYIVKAGAAHEEVARLKLGTATFATPAFLDKRIYVRTPEQLYCIEAL